MVIYEREKKVSLVVFSCEGREELMRRTYESFNEACQYNFEKVLFAIDGSYSTNKADNINYDIIVQNKERKGYILNILNALSIVDTEFFFWLEDDWRFLKDVDIKEMKRLLLSNPSWAQIRLSKHPPRPSGADELFVPQSAFGAGCCLCRTEVLQEGFQALQKKSRDSSTGFEEYISNWCTTKGFESRKIAPKGEAAIEHTGYLESTERRWHMTSSIKETDNYVPRFEEPALWRRFYMIAKLAYKFAKVSVRQLWSREAYDLAFRISQVKENKL